MSFTASLTADTFRKLGHVATPFDQKNTFPLPNLSMSTAFLTGILIGTLEEIWKNSGTLWEFWNSGRILELWKNSGTLEEFWNSGRILEPWKNSGGTLGEFWRNSRRILKKFRKNSLIICFFSKAVVQNSTFGKSSWLPNSSGIL